MNFASRTWTLELTFLLRSAGPTIIPSCVKSSVSFRLVPDQDLDTIADSIVLFIRTSYARLASTNSISVSSAQLEPLASKRKARR